MELTRQLLHRGPASGLPPSPPASRQRSPQRSILPGDAYAAGARNASQRRPRDASDLQEDWEVVVINGWETQHVDSAWLKKIEVLVHAVGCLEHMNCCCPDKLHHPKKTIKSESRLDTLQKIVVGDGISTPALDKTVRRAKFLQTKMMKVLMHQQACNSWN